MNSAVQSSSHSQWRRDNRSRHQRREPLQAVLPLRHSRRQFLQAAAAHRLRQHPPGRQALHPAGLRGRLPVRAGADPRDPGPNFCLPEVRAGPRGAAAEEIR
uniref:Uncharacterized protein n=1 Tax=Macrostomum lignano TaxID=282301 RepID=A0A1I8HTT8_9PLAT